MRFNPRTRKLVLASAIVAVAGGAIASSVNAATTTASPPVAPLVKAPDFSMHLPRLRAAHLRTGGKTIKYAITLASIGGYSGVVTLSANGLPAGTSGSFTVNPAPLSTTVPPSPTSYFMLTVAPTAVPGTYPFTVTGLSGSLTHTFNTAVEIFP